MRLVNGEWSMVNGEIAASRKLKAKYPSYKPQASSCKPKAKYSSKPAPKFWWPAISKPF
jgi:hypothetical protein